MYEQNLPYQRRMQVMLPAGVVVVVVAVGVMVVGAEVCAGPGKGGPGLPPRRSRPAIP